MSETGDVSETRDVTEVSAESGRPAVKLDGVGQVFDSSDGPMTALEDINLADVVMDMEDDLNLVECFCEGGRCIITPVCDLRHAFDQALNAYLGTLKQYTLADLLAPQIGRAHV